MANYRNRKLLDLAHRVQTCQGCGIGTPDGCEPAHANWSIYGKGMSIKAHDNFHAALCHWCHAGLDQDNKMSREEKMEFWYRAHIATMLLYFESEWLRVT